MNRSRWRLRLLSSLLLMIALTPPVQARPAVFSNLTFTEARQAARKEDKLMIVDFMAEWCGPCKQMDKTTWSDPVVKTWVDQNAIALQLDVDKDTKIAAALHVNAMPTIVLFAPTDKTTELERKVGYRDSTTLLSWLNAAKSGKSTSQFLQDQVTKAEGTPQEYRARLDLAKELLQAEDFAPATAQYLWLWQHRSDPGAVNSATLTAEMAMLAQARPDAKEKFVALRDQAENTNRIDWFTLNTIVAQDYKTQDWFDKVKNSTAEKPPWYGGERKIERVLVINSRWPDITILYKDPLTSLKKDYAQDVKSQQAFNLFPWHAGSKYAAYLAAGKDDMANEIAALAMQLDGRAEVKRALVKCAMAAHEPRPRQLLWSFEALDLPTKVAAVIISIVALVIICGAIVAGARALLNRGKA